MIYQRTVLVLTGLLYVGLGSYCGLFPDAAARSVHLEPLGAGGRSEFLTVYGGLEIGLGLTFLYFSWHRIRILNGLMACFLIHAGIVLFRGISLIQNSAVWSETRSLVIGEWVILILAGLGLAFASSQRKQ